MPVLHKDWLFLDEPHTGSQACIKALLQIPGTALIGKQHEPWPSLGLQDMHTFSVVRNPLDIIMTLATLSESVPYWLIRKYRHRDPFFTHRCETTLFYESGLKQIIEREVGVPLIFETINKTPGKVPAFNGLDYKFACATIPELFTFNYVPWADKNMIRQSDIDNYIEKHGDQHPHERRN